MNFLNKTTSYIFYILSFLAILFSIKLPRLNIYIGEVILKGFFNKIYIIIVFFISYYFSLKSSKIVEKRHYQWFMTIISIAMFISIVSNLIK